MNVEFQLNGRTVQWEVEPGETLLHALRRQGLLAAKRGCETGDCGSCTVLLQGQPVNSCVVAAARVRGRQLTTLEGLREDPLMIRLQTALAEHGAVQCGYCTPGMLISLYALLQEEDPPDEGAIRHALSGNLCRCTGYVKPIEAVVAVVAGLGGES